MMSVARVMRSPPPCGIHGALGVVFGEGGVGGSVRGAGDGDTPASGLVGVECADLECDDFTVDPTGVVNAGRQVDEDVVVADEVAGGNDGGKCAAGKREPSQVGCGEQLEALGSVQFSDGDFRHARIFVVT